LGDSGLKNKSARKVGPVGGGEKEKKNWNNWQERTVCKTKRNPLGEGGVVDSTGEASVFRRSPFKGEPWGGGGVFTWARSREGHGKTNWGGIKKKQHTTDD